MASIPSEAGSETVAVEQAATVQVCGSRGSSRRQGLSRRALARALRYMEENLGEPLTLARIAGAACLSRSHFARAFRASTGYTVMAYLCGLRIKRAKALLTESDIGIAELSALLGFSHHSHFTRVFRHVVGVSPRAYARLHGEDPPDGAEAPAAPAGDAIKQHASSN